jgi:hypothetical protein
LLSSIGPGVLISNKSFQKTASGFCRWALVFRFLKNMGLK